MDYSVIIPSYNESKTIRHILESLTEHGVGMSFEVIVVDDGSTDNTAQIVEEFSRNTDVDIKIIKLEKNIGKTGAVVAGIKKSKGKYIAIQDADLEYDPAELFDLLKTANEEDLDVLYGSRLLKKNSTAYPIYLLGSMFITKVFNTLFSQKITDLTTCYKIFKKEIINVEEINEARFGFCPQISCIFSRKGYIIKELPITYNPRRIEEGKKIRPKDGISFLWIILKNFLIQQKSTLRKKEM